MKNNKYLIAFDMDGTLLEDQNKTITPKTKEYLKKLNKDGHVIVLASGRPYQELKPYYEELELSSPLVCFNGLHCFNPHDNEFKGFRFSYPKEWAIDIINNLLNKECDNAFAETDEKIWMLKYDEDIIKAMWPHENDRKHIFGDFKDIIDDDPMTLILISKNIKANEENILNYLKKYPKTNIRPWYGGLYIELFFDKISKAQSLEDIRKYYHIKKENTIAFGDYSNDIEMIKWANHGVAMANAIEDVKKEAKYITKLDNNSDGIIDTLKQIIEKK